MIKHLINASDIALATFNVYILFNKSWTNLFWKQKLGLQACSCNIIMIVSDPTSLCHSSFINNFDYWKSVSELKLTASL